MMWNDKPFPIVPNTIKTGLITHSKILANSSSAGGINVCCVTLINDSVALKTSLLVVNGSVTTG